MPEVELSHFGVNSCGEFMVNKLLSKKIIELSLVGGVVVVVF